MDCMSVESCTLCSSTCRRNLAWVMEIFLSNEYNATVCSHSFHVLNHVVTALTWSRNWCVDFMFLVFILITWENCSNHNYRIVCGFTVGLVCFLLTYKIPAVTWYLLVIHVITLTPNAYLFPVSISVFSLALGQVHVGVVAPFPVTVHVRWDSSCIYVVRIVHYTTTLYSLVCISFSSMCMYVECWM